MLGVSVGAVISLGGQAIVGGLISLGQNLVSDTILSLSTGSNQFGPWHEYAVSFIMGGLVRFGKKNPGRIGNLVKKFPEWIVAPIVDQVVNYVFEQTLFSKENVFTRMILNGMFELIKADFNGADF